MAKLTLSDKATRALRFLMAVRNPRIASALMTYGFKESDLADGFEHLNRTARVKLHAITPVVTVDSTTVAEVDTLENRWFPIISASLARHYPATHALVFKNLSQTDGPAVLVSMRTLVERIAEMKAGTGAYGAEGPKAAALLESRGFNQEVIQRIQGLLESVGKFTAPEPAHDVVTDPKELEKAESDLWAWYLEWSQIARVAVKQRQLLKQMGFVQTRKSKSEETDDGEEPDTDGDSPGNGGTPKPVTPVVTPHA